MDIDNQEFINNIIELLTNNLDIRAIKYIKEEKNFDINYSKNIVDEIKYLIEAGGPRYSDVETIFNRYEKYHDNTVDSSKDNNSIFESTVINYINNGEKNNALKYIRETKQVNLDEAFNMLAQIEQSMSYSFSNPPKIQSTILDKSPEVNKTSQNNPYTKNEGNFLLHIEKEINNGQVFAAIKIYMTNTGADLKDAKEEVDKMVILVNRGESLHDYPFTLSFKNSTSSSDLFSVGKKDSSYNISSFIIKVVVMLIVCIVVLAVAKIFLG